MVAAVHADALHAVAEAVRGAAARGQRDPVAGVQQFLNQQFSDMARAADHQDILVHDNLLLMWNHCRASLIGNQTRKLPV
jgi:hypothetical protein